MSKSDIKQSSNDPNFESPRDRAQFKRSEAYDGVEMMNARFVNYAFAPHTHDELMIGVLHSGIKRFKREGRTHLVSRYGLSINNAGDLHTGERAHGDFLSYSSMYLPSNALVQAGLPEDFLFADAVIEDREVWRFLGTAITSSHDSMLAEQCISEGLCLAAERFGRDKRIKTSSLTCNSAVSIVAEYIQENMARDLRLSHLSEIAGLSVRHLIRSFKQQLGVTPHRYLMSARIQFARRELRGSVELSQLSLDAGFADQAHFSKVFRSVMGTTPLNYRSSVSQELKRL